jgi:hypothetical protein
MRTIASISAAALAVSLIVSSGAFAWTADQSAPPASNGIDLSDPDNFKALQDKVNGKTGDSGFQFSTTVGSGNSGFYGGTNPYGIQPLNGNGSAFSYSPIPGFRGQPN